MSGNNSQRQQHNPSNWESIISGCHLFSFWYCLIKKLQCLPVKPKESQFKALLPGEWKLVEPLMKAKQGVSSRRHSSRVPLQPAIPQFAWMQQNNSWRHTSCCCCIGINSSLSYITVSWGERGVAVFLYTSLLPSSISHSDILQKTSQLTSTTEFPGRLDMAFSPLHSLPIFSITNGESCSTITAATAQFVYSLQTKQNWCNNKPLPRLSYEALCKCHPSIIFYRFLIAPLFTQLLSRTDSK